MGVGHCQGSCQVSLPLGRLVYPQGVFSALEQNYCRLGKSNPRAFLDLFFP